MGMNKLNVAEAGDMYSYVLGILRDDGLTDVSTLQAAIDTFLVGRIRYRLFDPMLDDSVYDGIKRILTRMVKVLGDLGVSYDVLGIHPEMCKLREIIEQVYEMDEFPWESFQRLRYSEKDTQVWYEKYLNKVSKEEHERRRRWLGTLKIEEDGMLLDTEELQTRFWNAVANDDPKSIRPVEDMQEAFKWFQTVVGKELCASLKMDGINMRLYYLHGNYCGACTRGRNEAEVRDFTEAMGKVVPLKLNEDYTGFIRTETYVEPSALEYFREKYSRKYVVPRTAVNTVLSLPHDARDYAHVKSYCFRSVDAGTLWESMEWAAKEGFETPYKEVICWRGGTYQEFTVWITDVLNRFKENEKRLGLKTDGVVVEINDQVLAEQGVTDTMYNESNLALKFGPWEPGVYEAVLEDILITKPETNVRYNCRGKIKPVLIESGITINYINLHNLGLVMNAGIKVGDVIRFKFKNDNASELIY